jgi:hypothetical protein
MRAAYLLLDLIILTIPDERLTVTKFQKYKLRNELSNSTVGDGKTQ